MESQKKIFKNTLAVNVKLKQILALEAMDESIKRMLKPLIKEA